MMSGVAEQLLALDPGARAALLRDMPFDMLEALYCDWSLWGRSEQLLPTEREWSYWLLLAGRGFGKTRTGAEACRAWIRQGFNYVNLIAATVDDARDIMIDGESGLMAVCSRSERPVHQAYRRRLVWPNGAISLIFTAEEPNRLRGKQHQKIWADELASWRYSDAWVQAKLGLRIGRNPQAVITTTPRPTPVILELLNDPDTYVTRGTSYDNRSNLSPKFYSSIIKQYEGTRLGRQELNGEVLEDNPGALYRIDDIDAGRIQPSAYRREDMGKIVVAIDPAASSNEESDETGIVAAATNGDEYFVLEDWSGIYTPRQWAERASALAEYVGADRIVAEDNNGGEMVEYTLRTVNPDIPFRRVHATRGKTLRAEPSAAAYEQHRVHHVGVLPKLEDQMVKWNPTVGNSPDRLDALVWALTALGLGYHDTTGIIRYTQQLAEESRKMPSQSAANAIEAMRMQAHAK